jgi:predicted amidohydrolase YtcJ
MTKTVFINGRVFEYDGWTGRAKFCDTLITEGTKIVHVGFSDDGITLAAKREEGAKIVDLANRVVLPGFIDSHVHLLQFGQSLEKLDLSYCTSLEATRQAISQYAESRPLMSRILCRGWLQTNTGGKGLASMLDDLDSRPIYIEAGDLHSTWCSSSALAELPMQEILEKCPEDVQVDENNNPTGVLAERAHMAYVAPYLASLYTTEEKQRSLKLAVDSYVSAGYTGVVDMLMDCDTWDALRLYRENNGGLPLHLAAHWFVSYDEDKEVVLSRVDAVIEMYKTWHPSKSPEFCILGPKMIYDGVVDGFTAALSRPYRGQFNLVEPIWPVGVLNEVVQRAADAGMQCAIHAIGDVAITQAIDAIEAVHQPDARHRVEHLELATAADAKRLGRLGITASIQPVHSDPDTLKAYPALIGKDLWSRVFPYREFLDGHACVAIGTDAPTARHLPLPNLYNATTRKSALDPLLDGQTNPKGALSLVGAVAAATAGGAYARFADKWTGALRKGLQADFVVLNTAWTPESMLESSVYQTWSKGIKVFERNQETEKV